MTNLANQFRPTNHSTLIGYRSDTTVVEPQRKPGTRKRPGWQVIVKTGNCTQIWRFRSGFRAEEKYQQAINEHRARYPRAEYVPRRDKGDADLGCRLLDEYLRTICQIRLREVK